MLIMTVMRRPILPRGRRPLHRLLRRSRGRARRADRRARQRPADHAVRVRQAARDRRAGAEPPDRSGGARAQRSRGPDPREAARGARQGDGGFGDGRRGRGGGRPREGAVQPDHRRRVRRGARAVRDDPRRAEAADAADDHAPEGRRTRRGIPAPADRRSAASRIRAQEGPVLRGAGIRARRRDRSEVLSERRRGPAAVGRPESRRSGRGSSRAPRSATSPRRSPRGRRRTRAATSASSRRESSSRLSTPRSS